jgi:hypothetical protein
MRGYESSSPSDEDVLRLICSHRIDSDQDEDEPKLEEYAEMD